MKKTFLMKKTVVVGITHEKISNCVDRNAIQIIKFTTGNG